MMRQQIIVSGLGGQGVLFLTRVIAQAALERGLNVLTAETHGMAQRGGSVLSTIKVGDFHSPLIRAGQADVGLFLYAGNLGLHRPLLRPDGREVINRSEDDASLGVDASGLARAMGAPVLANLILLGCALRHGLLFCDQPTVEAAIAELAPAKLLEQNLAALRLGMKA